MCAHTHTDTNTYVKYGRQIWANTTNKACEWTERAQRTIVAAFCCCRPPKNDGRKSRPGQSGRQAGRRTERQMTDWLAGTCQSENRDIISAWHELKSIMTNILQSVRSLLGLRVRTACQREWTCVFVHVSLCLCVCVRLSACVAQVFSPCALFSLRFVVALLLRLDTSVAVWSRILFK